MTVKIAVFSTKPYLGTRHRSRRLERGSTPLERGEGPLHSVTLQQVQGERA